MTFKNTMYQICETIAEEFPEWPFKSGVFKNKSLKHSDLMISPSFYFDRGDTAIQPSIRINNKKVSKLSNILLGSGRDASLVNFQELDPLLIPACLPENQRPSWRVYEDKRPIIAALHIPGPYYSKEKAEAIEKTMLDAAESIPILRSIMKDGITFIDRHYDLSSEENFLKALPARYKTRNDLIYREMEMEKGVTMCIVHVLLGDFDFVDHYASDDYKTVFPKRTADIQKILAALPDLKRKYTETGKVI
jgi:hypothetical protein